MRTQITFRSGAQIEVDINKIETRDDMTGRLTNFAWTTPDNWSRKLHDLNLSEVVAIVVVREPEAS